MFGLERIFGKPPAKAPEPQPHRDEDTFLGRLYADMALAAGDHAQAIAVLKRFRAYGRDDVTLDGPIEGYWNDDDVGVCSAPPKSDDELCTLRERVMMGRDPLTFRVITVSGEPCTPFWRGVNLLHAAACALTFAEIEKQVQAAVPQDRTYVRNIERIKALAGAASLVIDLVNRRLEGKLADTLRFTRPSRDGIEQATAQALGLVGEKDAPASSAESRLRARYLRLAAVFYCLDDWSYFLEFLAGMP